MPTPTIDDQINAALAPEGLRLASSTEPGWYTSVQLNGESEPRRRLWVAEVERGIKETPMIPTFPALSPSSLLGGPPPTLARDLLRHAAVLLSRPVTPAEGAELAAALLALATEVRALTHPRPEQPREAGGGARAGDPAPWWDERLELHAGPTTRADVAPPSPRSPRWPE
jgi:hypothetical protein